jgi:[lysine-biosynthesis-protein LysW]--L-2-aminoadipate ligase
LGIRIGLLFDQIRWEEKAILETAKSRGIDINLIDSKSSILELTSEEKTQDLGDVVLQRCISYFRGLHLTAALENRGYTVINCYKVAEICGNKLLSTLALSKAKIPTPKTYVAFTPESAVNALDKIGYPALLKPIVGSWGRFIVPLNDRATAEAIFEEREYMFPLYQVYYIQEMVKRPPRDIRIIVIGQEAVAGMYRYSFQDVKTNISRGGKAEQCKITDDLREISLKAADAVGEGILGVDMMETENGILVHEINHTVEFRGIAAATGISIPKMIVGYLIRKAKK